MPDPSQQATNSSSIWEFAIVSFKDSIWAAYGEPSSKRLSRNLFLKGRRNDLGLSSLLQRTAATPQYERIQKTFDGKSFSFH